MKCGAMNCKRGALPRAATPCQNSCTMRGTKAIPPSGTCVSTSSVASRMIPSSCNCFISGWASSAIFLLCCYAPFTRWQKVYLAFGYFSFYEYLIVSRNYVLGVLALVAFCVVRTQWPKRMLTAAALLAIMSNTSALGAIIALALGGWLLLESFRRRDTVSLAPCLGVVFVLGVGLAVAVILTSPPPDSLPRMLAWNTSLLGAELEKTCQRHLESVYARPGDAASFLEYQSAG